MKSLSFLFSLFSLAILTLSAAHADTLTYPQLVHRLTDLDHLATPPEPGELGALASSYDRASQYDAVHDKYIGWDANGDNGGIIRQEGDESVMAEIKGPGCIWRTWSAAAGDGHVKIYLDGVSTPAVDLPFSGYFNGKSEPFTRPHIAYITKASGFNNYTPIPFLKSCKIVADKDWGGYYHFNYTQFSPGTVVPTFKLPLSAEDSAALDAADKILGNCGVDPAGGHPGQKSETANLTVHAGQIATVAQLSGAGAITALKVKFALPADPAVLKDFLRQLAIRITWDGSSEPAVWSPLGDFFGDAVIPAKYQSLPMGITDDGQWYSYWYMPYGSGAKIEMENDSTISVAMNWEVDHVPLTTSASSLLRFHAKWHRDAFLPQRKDRWPDWTLLTTKGTGRYVGTQLHIWNPLLSWWGEGDEKWFVDGEKFPSTIGTGSEDYFGYAWGSPNIFNQAFHGQPVNEGNQGNISNHRWHISDNIPFQKSFDGYIEKYFPNSRPTLYAAVAYWYLSADGTDPYPEVPVADRIGYYTRPFMMNPDGTLAAKYLRVINSPAVIVRDMTPFGTTWSNDLQVFWRTHTDDQVEFELNGVKGGQYQLAAAYTHGSEYGIFQISVNGAPAGPPVDTYDDKFAPAPFVDLGTINLKDGADTIDIKTVGKNPKENDGTPDCLGALDYLKLTPVP